MKVTEFSSAIKGSIGVISKQTCTSGEYLDGDVRTPYGIVAVYSQGSGQSPARMYTSLTFALEHRLYHRAYSGRVFSKRGLAIIAGRFAKEICDRVWE